MSRKSEKSERASPPVAGQVPTDRRDRASMPAAGSRSPRTTDRGDLRDLLGDYTEQTGAHFG